MLCDYFCCAGSGRDSDKGIPAEYRKAPSGVEASQEFQITKLDALPERPLDAVGTFHRIITVNDVYSLEHLPRVAAAVDAARKASTRMDCVVTSHCNGDFLSPCTFTALDRGVTMVEAMNYAQIDYFCLGNHEFDIGFKALGQRLCKFNGTIINSNCDVPEVSQLPRYETLKIGERTAVLAGLLMDEESVYTKPLPAITPVSDACFSVWQQAKKSLNVMPDIFLPMTHQFIEDDQATATEISKHPELAGRTPCILGGHEHEPFIEKAGNSLIVKVGQDATDIGIVDIWWRADGSVNCRCSTIKASSFPECASAKKFVKRKQEYLQNMMTAPIAELTSPASSEIVRFEASGIASFILDFVRRGLANQGVEIALLNAANIRGRKEYSPGPFTMGDLFTENPWDNEMAIVSLPGKVLAETILFSRTGEGQKPGFLQTDSGAEFTAEHKLVKVNGKAFSQERTYTVAIIVHLLTGMDTNKPLLDYVAKTGMKVPDPECCKLSKDVTLAVCMQDAWRRILGVSKMDTDCDGDLEQAELSDAVELAFNELDRDNSGSVSKQEVLEYLQSKNVQLVEQMIHELDDDDSGNIQRSEIEELIDY